VCIGTRGVVLCKSRVSRELRMQAVCLLQAEERMEIEGGKKGYIYSSSCDLIHILRNGG
jgi:hypothetical protein